MSTKKQIQEGLIDKFFGVFEKGLEKSRKKATVKALKDPKVQREFKEIKKNIENISKRIDALNKQNPHW